MSATITETFHEYMTDKVRLSKWQKVGVLMLVWVFAGFFGWVYEFIFYFFNGGMEKFYMQGGNFLPWINIYAIGAILILVMIFSLHLKRRPLLVFLLSMIITGVLEFVAGWLVYTIGGGTRYWDYNTEILNFGNIDGFVCLRSVLVFGVSALMLMYLVVPVFIWMAQRMSKRAFLVLAILLFSIVMLDEVYNILASKILLDLMDATEVYRALGLEYV